MALSLTLVHPIVHLIHLMAVTIVFSKINHLSSVSVQLIKVRELEQVG